MIKEIHFYILNIIQKNKQTENTEHILIKQT